MRRLTLLALLAAAASAAGFLAPASGVTDGERDGDAHPSVGLLVGRNENGFRRCSGTLVSPTIFLTAGHCLEDIDDVQIWFEPGPILTDPTYDPSAHTCEGVEGYPCKGDATGTPYLHPDYDPAAPTLADLGVVVLDQPVELDAYPRLPERDQLDGLRANGKTAFTTVGYGLQREFPDPAGWKDVTTRERRVVHPTLMKINDKPVGDYAMLVSSNASTGGTCSGDSGAPTFLGGSTVVAGVVSFTTNDNTCRGQDGVYRVDRADDLDWLTQQFGPLL